MYSYEDKMRAVDLYIKYDKNMSVVIRELGYPSRQMLYLWYKEFTKTGSLQDTALRHSKCSAEQREQAIEYYLEHGRSITGTIKALGFPKRTTLRDWIKNALPEEKKGCVTGKVLVKCTQEQKEQAVIRLCAGDGAAKEIAAELGVTDSSLRRWKKNLLCEERAKAVPKKKKTSSGNHSDLVAERDVLEQQLEQLQKEVYRLQLEHDVLKKADEILKKGRGINLEILTNREKAILIDALRDRYRLKELLGVLCMVKSSYCYQQQALSRPDKYADLRVEVKEIFTEAHSCWTPI